MTSFTKHQSNKLLEKNKQIFSNYIKNLITILPKEYTFEIIISYLQKYYPYDIQEYNEIYEYYNLKNKKLTARNIKTRHTFPELTSFLEELQIIKEILNDKFKSDFKFNFNEKKQIENLNTFLLERIPKIKRIEDKIKKAKLKAQEVEPLFLDKLIGYYDRKTTLQKDKIYIFKELERYYCKKTITFFKKKVDTEYNFQLREMAFKHLQSLKHFAVLRNQKYMKLHTKNKKRKKFLKNTYANERFNIKSIPQELEYRIENSKEQKLNNYHFFISHSSINFEEVQSIIKVLNKENKNVYCDWINDTSYLKRHLVGDATKSVIEKRLEQSNKVLFIKSKESLLSNWVKYELNYFNSLNKEILEIDISNLRKGKYEYKRLKEKWFYDENYKNINLYKNRSE